MSLVFRSILKFVLISGVIAATGCSWPSVKVGNDEYLFGPPTSIESTKGTQDHSKSINLIRNNVDTVGLMRSHKNHDQS
jgi:hypothetical protein